VDENKGIKHTEIKDRSLINQRTVREKVGIKTAGMHQNG
jgi:hypothetical protein